MRACTLLVFAAMLFFGGCWYAVEEYCPGCTTVDLKQPAVPQPAPSVRTQVVLVHGAFGFGDEWLPVVAALRESSDFAFFAWTWPGPFRNPPRAAQALAQELQLLVDGLPPTVEEVLVLAHSAGGLIANFAARKLRVPPRLRVTVALLDPALRWRIAKKEEYLPLPPGVSMRIYFDGAKPRSSPSALPPDPSTATDLPREYVGPFGHNPMVGKVVLPLLAARRRL